MGCRLSLSRKVRTSRQRGGRVCAGNPGRVSCTMMIPIFQNFFEVLKNASACRKDFFDTLRRQPYGLPPSYSVGKWNHSAFSTASVR